VQEVRGGIFVVARGGWQKNPAEAKDNNAEGAETQRRREDKQSQPQTNTDENRHNQRQMKTEKQ